MRLETLSTILLMLGIALPLPTAHSQESDGKTALERAREAKQREHLETQPTLLDASGQPILPGRLPAGASAEARALWKKVLESGGTARPIRSFELSFYLRQRDPEHPQVNDMSLQFSYLVPGYVRAVLESGRTLLRGPRGDWLIDASEVIHLMGREGIEDRKQLDQMASLARNFVSLSDPRSLRLVELELAGSAPEQLPARFQRESEKLTWLHVVSPDFFLRPEESSRPRGHPLPLYTATLGIDPETSEIRFAALQEQSVKVVGERETITLLASSAILVHLTEYMDRNGFRVPHRLHVYHSDGSRRPWRYASTPTSELNLRRRRGSLRAGLGPEDFDPPRKD